MDGNIFGRNDQNNGLDTELASTAVAVKEMQIEATVKCEEANRILSLILETNTNF